MSSSLMPHAVCWSQDQRLIWTMAVTNAITFFSYFSICVTLFYLRRKTRGAIAPDWTFFLMAFGIFIVSCGSTHLMEVVTTWIPVFWIDASTNILTAVFSAYVAVQFAHKAPELGYGINDYANRLASAEKAKARVEESLISARKLEEWNRMSAVVAHEVASPLAAIQNLLFLIQITPGISPETEKLVQQSSDEARRIEVLMRSTLGFFRQSAEPELVDLAASAEAVRFLLGPVMRQRSIEFHIHREGNCNVYAYAVETRQVLLNLVRNACEATTRSGAPVTISLEGRPDDVRVEIADEGAGMDPVLLTHLFEFGVTTKGDRGNGMGLWLVQQLVRRHGGTIDVNSKPGEGTRFTIYWPRRIPDGGTRHDPALVSAEP